MQAFGQARLAAEVERGGVSLDIPEQEIHDGEAGYSLAYRANVAVESYNAQLSLVTGIAAAQMMRAAGVGILRTLPPAEQRDLTRLRHTARALGLEWPETTPYADFVRSLSSADPAEAAFMNEATTLFRGAGYETFRDGAPSEPHPHAAIAAEYAHVTAPLRRLVDRYGLEICAAHCAGREVPAWVRAALDELPAEMADATRLANRYERSAVDIVEAGILAGHVGETFAAVVVEERKEGGIVLLRTPAVRGYVTGDLSAGTQVRVRVLAADVPAGSVELELVTEAAKNADAL
ncbi:MAG: hypothetical protein Q4P36_01765 [Bowdeniella nasicola]|nr:hypothetical protein [Bowdeniella nasicola]